MRCRRTANAGVLLELDDVTILLDGVCRETESYYGTPDSEREALFACFPDLTAFTHGHTDHFDRTFARNMYHKTLRSILGPEGLLKEGTACEPVTVNNVRVTPIPSRHIGRAGKDTPHVSFLIEGSKRILFTGDAAPTQWKDIKADVLIAPYAYATTETGWRSAGHIAEHMILLHLPKKDTDPYGLWEAVKTTTRLPGPVLYIPEIGQTICL